MKSFKTTKSKKSRYGQYGGMNNGQMGPGAGGNNRNGGNNRHNYGGQGGQGARGNKNGGNYGAGGNGGLYGGNGSWNPADGNSKNSMYTGLITTRRRTSFLYHCVRLCQKSHWNTDGTHLELMTKNITGTTGTTMAAMNGAALEAMVAQATSDRRRSRRRSVLLRVPTNKVRWKNRFIP